MDRRPGSWIKDLLAIIISLGVLIGGGYFVVTKASDWIRTMTASGEDYPGPGETEVIVQIPAGSTTITQIGQILFSADVVASTEAFRQRRRRTRVRPASSRAATG